MQHGKGGASIPIGEVSEASQRQGVDVIYVMRAEVLGGGPVSHLVPEREVFGALLESEPEARHLRGVYREMLVHGQLGSDCT